MWTIIDVRKPEGGSTSQMYGKLPQEKEKECRELVKDYKPVSDSPSSGFGTKD